MTIEIRIPSVGESVKEAVLAEWFKKDGERVAKDEALLVIETDKVTLEVTAEADGVLKILVPAGKTVAIGAVVGTILPSSGAAAAAPTKPALAVVAPPEIVLPPTASPVETPGEGPALAPSVRRLAAERGVDPSRIAGSGPGGRVTKGDVLLHLEGAAATPVAPTAAAPSAPLPAAAHEGVTRKPMSPIRQRIAARLLEARRNTAMLTTFNEIDMSRVSALRQDYREPFQKRHGVALGFMSFFIRACIEALRAFPELNAFIEEQEILYHDSCHIGVAIGSERGLVVPVIRHAERLSLADIERAIGQFVEKIKDNRLELTDLEGGTFTVSNGGVYGSLLSTPILNTPQSGILGMHKIEKRPVVVEDQIVIRPMMYVALSYDHRIVDGREAVSFLKRIKECVENPERILLEV